jgi:hypothetical protein
MVMFLHTVRAPSSDWRLWHTSVSRFCKDKSTKVVDVDDSVVEVVDTVEEVEDVDAGTEEVVTGGA